MYEAVYTYTMNTNDKTIKIFPGTYKRILNIKRETRLSIKYIVEDAIDLLTKTKGATNAKLPTERKQNQS